MKSSNRELGNHGEDLACKFLEKNGYKIIERNKSFSKFSVIVTFLIFFFYLQDKTYWNKYSMTLNLKNNYNVILHLRFFDRVSCE